MGSFESSNSSNSTHAEDDIRMNLRSYTSLHDLISSSSHKIGSSSTTTTGSIRSPWWKRSLGKPSPDLESNIFTANKKMLQALLIRPTNKTNKPFLTVLLQILKERITAISEMIDRVVRQALLSVCH